MNRLQIRQQFRVLSGRYDLVSSVGVDNGADFFIDSGQKWLDRKYATEKTAAVTYRLVDPGTYFVAFQYCRSIKEVWAADSSNGRWQLDKKPFQDLRAEYQEMWVAMDRSTPLYYSPALIRSSPGTDRVAVVSMSAMAGFVDVMDGPSHSYNGVVILPPPSVQTHIEVLGHFYTAPLESDEHENYWSVNHPDILIMAAMRQIEVFNRNTKGREDIEEAIKEMILDIDKDVVEEELPEVMQLEG